MLFSFFAMSLFAVSQTCVLYEGNLQSGDRIGDYVATEVLTERIAFVEKALQKRRRAQTETSSTLSPTAAARLIAVSQDESIRLEGDEGGVEATDEGFPSQWGLVNTGQTIRGAGRTFTGVPGIDIRADQAWTLTTGSEETVVAVIDTGIETTHPDLHDNLWVNTAEQMGRPGHDDDGNGIVDDIYGFDAYKKSGPFTDSHGHGTSVAGVIGATGDNGVGISGVNWNVRLMGVKITDEKHEGHISSAVRGIVYAVKNGAQVINYSMGSYNSYNLCFKAALEYARDSNVLFVSSAGNDGTNNDNRSHYPSNYAVDNVLAVAALTYAGKLKRSSNYGKHRVHLSAPGEQILTTGLRGRLRFIHGTSFASPHVAGVAALIYSKYPGISYDEVRYRILNGVQLLDELNGRVLSGGLLDAFAALEMNAPAPLPPVDLPSDIVTLEEDQRIESPHRYPANARLTYQVARAGAKRVRVLFSKIHMGRGDRLELYDQRGRLVKVYKGRKKPLWSPWVEGESIEIVLKSDRRSEKYGFLLTKVAHKRVE